MAGLFRTQSPTQPEYKNGLVPERHVCMLRGELFDPAYARRPFDQASNEWAGPPDQHRIGWKHEPCSYSGLEEWNGTTLSRGHVWNRSLVPQGLSVYGPFWNSGSL